VKLDPTKRDCRREIVRLFNLASTDKITTAKATKLSYILQIVLKSIETDELRWAASSDAQPSPQRLAEQIRAAMREANSQIPGAPEGE